MENDLQRVDTRRRLHRFAQAGRISRRVRRCALAEHQHLGELGFFSPVGSLAKSGSVSQTNNLWAAIVGLKGQVRLGESQWFRPYYADIGGSSGNWTWQAALGVGYHFGWGDTVLLVRSLSYDFNDKLDLRMTGPMLGATFKF